MDLFNLVKLNETVDMLQQRVQSIEADMKEVSNNTQYVADELRAVADKGKHKEIAATSSSSNGELNCASMKHLVASSSSSNGHWSLSLTPNGLRIDTNIISLQDLYDILLSGVSRLDINQSGKITVNNSNQQQDSDNSSQSSSSVTSSTVEGGERTIVKKKSLWKNKLKTFPLYSTWEPHSLLQQQQQNNKTAPETLPKEITDKLMDIYSECLLCLPCCEPDDSVVDRYRKGTLDPLLMNAVLAWTARHAAIYHDLFPGQDPNIVGESFFERARDLLKDRFTVTSVDTMHSLLVMYVYAIGRTSKQRRAAESEAYMYLGLAIRMCLDMKMYQESTDPDPVVRERSRRFFWAIYFLETLCTVHSDKQFALPPEEVITVGYPTVMDHEVGEKRWRVAFARQRFRITHIYREIIYKTAQEKPLLSTVSTLDKALKDWYAELEPELKYAPGDIHRRNWKSTSFREQTCIKLNLEYNFQLCQLYGLFCSKPNEDEPSSAIGLLSKEQCLRAADTIVELLECYSRLQQLWCHFSLEPLMVSTMVFSNQLSQSKEEAEYAKHQLERLGSILMTSPVRHHKYVIALVKRIQKMLAEHRPDDLDLERDEEEITTTSSSRPPEDSMPQVEVKQEPGTTNPFNINTPASSSLDMQKPTMFEQSMQNMLDMTSTSFDPTIKDSSDHSTPDAMQLSDFLYAPTVMDYCASLSPPESSSNHTSNTVMMGLENNPIVPSNFIPSTSFTNPVPMPYHYTATLSQQPPRWISSTSTTSTTTAMMPPAFNQPYITAADQMRFPMAPFNNPVRSQQQQQQGSSTRQQPMQPESFPYFG